MDLKQEVYVTTKSRLLKGLIALAVALNAKNGLAAALTAALAGATASQLGIDPWPWIVGAAGAAIAFLMRAPTIGRIAVANGGISILFGGLGAPYAAALLSHYVDPVWANDLVLAAVLSIGWPFFVPIAMGWFERFASALPVRRDGGQ